MDASANEFNVPNLKSLSHYADNTYSQFGEDGIIAEILRRLETVTSLDHWCAEFGAWDGVFLSNTCKLIRESSYSAVLIEGDPKRVEQLVGNFPQRAVLKICKFVSFEGPDTLDAIFRGTPIPSNFDFLSIDVDGVDYHIFESLRTYRPKVICVEFNPTIPNTVDFVQARDFGVKHGSSALAFVRLAKSKSYALVASTSTNLIFVDAAHLDSAALEEAHLEDLNEQGNDPQFVFVGYDGTILSNKDQINLIWHSLPVPVSKIQFLPKSLRVFSGDYRNSKRLQFVLFLLLRMPRNLARRIWVKATIRHSSFWQNFGGPS
jgi:hypothetical protein